MFEAIEPVAFPLYQTGNIFRGALGLGLRRASPAAYEKIFAPTRADYSQNGFADPPRPFVLRISHLEGKTMSAGAKFLLPIHSFSSQEAPLEVFETAFATESPFGGKVRLASTLPPEHICLQFQAAKQPVSSLSIRFLTPTELKTNGQIASEPEFTVLFSRACKRIQALQLLYAQPTQLEHKDLFAQAEKVTLVSHALVRTEANRVSSHTNQTHPLGGFRGEATYQGNFRELLPWLQAAQWTGIGRQTVWGKGEILVQSETEKV